MQQLQGPPISHFSLSGFLYFPYRICNPPPSVGKVRSCGVTPILDIHLDDVLDRKHLPPLGLKDFEEYLLYVEQSPENLYFLLWLKEYTSRYQIWAQRTKHSLSTQITSLDQSFRIPPSSDPSLALFYAKAKQTFFTPGADYELDVPSDILAPFHSPSHSPTILNSLHPSPHAHPDPAVFSEVALEARAMLKVSLSSFVRAASTNVGSQRAACGIAAGVLCFSLAGILPLTLTSGNWGLAPHGRWWRLVAFPGIWLGLVLLLSSFSGVCLMVYVFGDLRQLRKFELARPAISKPLPAPALASISSPVIRPPSPTKVVVSKHYDKHYSPELLSLQSPPYSISVQGRPVSPVSHSSSSHTELSRSSQDSSSRSSFDSPEIEVSPAYFDDVPAPEGPATATGLHRSHFRAQSSIAFPSMLHIEQRTNYAASFSPLEHHASISNVRNNAAVKPLPHAREDSDEFRPSAAFICHEFDLDTDIEAQKGHVTMQKESFDFDLLPNSARGNTIQTDNMRLASNSSVPVATSAVSTAVSTQFEKIAPLTSVIARQQYKCKRTYAPPTSSASSIHSPNSDTSSPTPSSSILSPLVSFMVPSFTAGVPAFKAPMTPVRSPVVIRAHWEIIMRSGVIALIGTVTLIAIMVGVVP